MESQEQALLNEVKEQLNQLLLKLDTVPETPSYEDGDYRTRLGKPDLDEDGDDTGEGLIDAGVKLGAIRDAIKIIISESKWDTGVVTLLEKYYDSSCY